MIEETLPAASSTTLTVLIDLLDALRMAHNLIEVNIAAGIARQELLDLAETACDQLNNLF